MRKDTKDNKKNHWSESQEIFIFLIEIREDNRR